MNAPLTESTRPGASPEEICTKLESVAKQAIFLNGTNDNRHKVLLDFVDSFQDVELAYMVDPTGVQNVANAAGRQTQVLYDGDGLGISRHDRAWFNIPNKSKKPYISRKYVSVATQQLCITVSVPVFSASGEFLGVVAADLQAGD